MEKSLGFGIVKFADDFVKVKRLFIDVLSS
jgi:hypothetical protein